MSTIMSIVISDRETDIRFTLALFSVLYYLTSARVFRDIRDVSRDISAT